MSLHVSARWFMPPNSNSVLVKAVISCSPHSWAETVSAYPLSQNWLRVFRSVNAAHLPHGVGQERETTAVQSEKCVARWGSEYDEMCMIIASFARVLQRCTGHLYMRFLLTFQEVRTIRKTCNHYLVFSYN